MIKKATLRKAVIYSAFLIILVFCVIRASKGSDFDIYLLASQALIKSQNIYNPELTDNVQYFYSPFFALALVPLSVIPFFISKFVWLILSTFFWFRINQIVIQALKRNHVKALSNWPIVLANLVLIGFIIDNYHMIQVTFLVLWGTLESLRLINSEKQWLGSSLLGLLINIKLLPLPFIPYLVYRNKIKAAVIAVCSAAALMLLPSLFLGWDYNAYLHQNWWATINPSSQGHVLETNILVFNIQALITSALTDASGSPIVSIQTIGNIILFSIALLSLTALLFLSKPVISPAKSGLHQLREISFLLLVTVIIFPHQNKYATVYIFPALHYIFNYLSIQIHAGKLRSNPTSIWILATAIVSVFLISLTGKDLVGKQLYLFFANVKSITIGEILLIPILAYLTPERVISAKLKCNTI